jgi:hypothetical protein
MLDLLGNLEGPEEADTPEDGHAEGRHNLLGDEDELQDAGDHHEEVEPVEQGHHVTLQERVGQE